MSSDSNMQNLIFIAYYLLLIVIFSRFVQAVLRYYYENDGQVQQDSELQNWILDIFEHGVLGQAATGGL